LNENERIDGLMRAGEDLRAEIGKVIVGQRDVIDELLIALFAGGHVLLEGVPGLAKTLLISTLAEVLDLSFSRIQFTPDLMPSSILGFKTIEPDAAGGLNVVFENGPIFANVVLADEINRTPPRTQSALLEAMQERQVTTAGRTLDLPAPFFVLATQNPIEHEGTYPLPEAQLDRFFFNISIGYPSAGEERTIIERTTGGAAARPVRRLDAEQVLAYRDVVHQAQAPEGVVDFAVRLVRATRPGHPGTAARTAKYLDWGAGPRAAQALLLGAKARALLQGRLTADVDDVVALAPPVLRHRLVANFHAAADEMTKDAIIELLLTEVAR
jgi:MoxR-like ATPase